MRVVGQVIVYQLPHDVGGRVGGQSTGCGLGDVGAGRPLADTRSLIQINDRSGHSS